MIRHLILTVAVLAVAASSPILADSWIFKPSVYSHNPMTGVRVVQYISAEPSYAPMDSTYMASGYRHMRSGLRGADGSADHLHVVETWGAGEAVRPYGEWLRPFRAGATPYGPWGNSQGPWTTPFGSWVNPYGLGKLPHPPWPHLPFPTPYPGPYPGPNPPTPPPSPPGP